MIEAEVSVFDRDTDDPAPIFADEVGGVELAQPVDTGPDGSLTFWHETDRIRVLLATVDPEDDQEIELFINRADIGAGGGGGIDPTIIDAAGDLIVGTGPDAVDNLPVGAAADGDVLTRDSGAPLGMGWTAPAGGGGGGVTSGLHADRPAPAPGNAGSFYYSTDRGLTYHSDGAAWLPTGPGVLVLGADQGPVADNNLVDSPDLRFPMYEGDHLMFQLWLPVEGTSVTPDIRVNVKPPDSFAGAAAVRWQQALAQFGVVQGTDPGALIAGSPISGLGPGIKGAAYAGWLRGDQLVQPGDPFFGEAVVQWSQNTNTPANPITMKAGAIMVLHDLVRP